MYHDYILLLLARIKSRRCTLKIIALYSRLSVGDEDRGQDETTLSRPNIDSINPYSLQFAPFINIINEYHVLETSKKIRASNKNKGMKVMLNLLFQFLQFVYIREYHPVGNLKHRILRQALKSGLR